jgi:lipoprotein-anchoring transpeptidase ErfK/SrfK
MAARPRPAITWAAGAAAFALAVAGAAQATPAPEPIASRPTTREAWTARVLLPVHTRSAPRADARRTGKLSVLAPYDRGPQVLLVTGARSTAKDGVWYRLLLPSRPNDATGWVPAEAVQVRRTPYRVVVRLGARRAELVRAGEVIGRWSVVVGTRANPTPTGRFAVSEVVRQANPGGFFGTYIITLSAHSANLSEFDGGDGRVALHGTNRPELLGTAASHGCVRLANAAATRLGRVVSPGAPVDVVR